MIVYVCRESRSQKSVTVSWCLPGGQNPIAFTDTYITVS